MPVNNGVFHLVFMSGYQIVTKLCPLNNMFLCKLLFVKNDEFCPAEQLGLDKKAGIGGFQGFPFGGAVSRRLTEKVRPAAPRIVRHVPPRSAAHRAARSAPQRRTLCDASAPV